MVHGHIHPQSTLEDASQPPHQDHLPNSKGILEKDEKNEQ